LRGVLLPLGLTSGDASFRDIRLFEGCRWLSSLMRAGTAYVNDAEEWERGDSWDVADGGCESEVIFG
jgi:hypothetical protein